MRKPSQRPRAREGTAAAAPQEPIAKSRDAQYVKLTAYVPRTLHINFKVHLVRQGREMSDVIAELVTDWLKRQGAQ